MLKKFIVCLCLFFSLAAVANEDECEAAVDAASRVNPNEDKNCDYSNTGLNGVLHRAFAKKQTEDGKAVDEKNSAEISNTVVAPNSSVSGEAAKLVSSGKVGSAEFASAQELERVRYELIKQAQKACSKGFVVQGERYLPIVSSSMRLELLYYCL